MVAEKNQGKIKQKWRHQTPKGLLNFVNMADKLQDLISETGSFDSATSFTRIKFWIWSTVTESIHANRVLRSNDTPEIVTEQQPCILFCDTVENRGVCSVAMPFRQEICFQEVFVTRSRSLLVQPVAFLSRIPPLHAISCLFSLKISETLTAASEQIFQLIPALAPHAVLTPLGTVYQMFF